MVDNSDDIIDSRDVIARITELSDDDYERDEDEDYELDQLQAFAEEGESLADWQHGETLIRDSYFVDYAIELADDIGHIDSEASWPMSCIDWPRAADELQMDYTPLDFGGVTYWGRS